MRPTALALLVAAALTGPALGLDEQDDLRTRFEKTRSAGDAATMTALLEGHRFEVIYLVDGYLEAWLKQMEMPAAERIERPDALLEAALAAAAAADLAFGGDAYSRYARAWMGWSADERGRFREGQRKFAAGRAAQKEEQYEEAATRYRESLQLAEPLGDLWGTAQAEQALGDLAFGAEEWEVALAHHERAREIFAALQHPRVLRSLHALGVLQEQEGRLVEARASLEELLRLTALAGRNPDTSKVRAALARICRALGDDAAAEEYEGG